MRFQISGELSLTDSDKRFVGFLFGRNWAEFQHAQGDAAETTCDRESAPAPAAPVEKPKRETKPKAAKVEPATPPPVEMKNDAAPAPTPPTEAKTSEPTGDTVTLNNEGETQAETEAKIAADAAANAAPEKETPLKRLQALVIKCTQEVPKGGGLAVKAIQSVAGEEVKKASAVPEDKIEAVIEAIKDLLAANEAAS